MALSLYHIPLPLSSASNQTDCRIPQVCLLTFGLCTCFSPLSPVLFSCPSCIYFCNTSSIEPPPPQYWHKAGCPLCRLLYLSIYDSVWKLPVCLFFQFMGYHFSGWTESPSSCNSSVCHSTFAHSYWVNEWRVRKTEALILSHMWDQGQIM